MGESAVRSQVSALAQAPQRWRLWLSVPGWRRVLRPEPVATRPWLVLAVGLAALVIALFRIPPRAWGVVWAEDGKVFLAEAHRSNPLTAVLMPYEGYACAFQRLAAEAASHLPLRWEGMAMSLSGGLLQAAVATLAFVVLSAHAGRPAGAVIALVVAAVPVGVEVVDNATNTGWFLLFAALIVPFWRPTGRFGRVVACAVLLVATLTTPFGAAAVLLAIVVALLTADRSMTMPVGIGSVGAAIQGWVMLTAPARATVSTQTTIHEAAAGWLRRTVADGLLGSGRYTEPISTTLKPGLLIAAAVLALVVWIFLARGFDAIVLPLVLLAMSFLLYVGTVTLAHAPTVLTRDAGRYAVVPVLLYLSAIAVLLRRLLSGGTPQRLIARFAAVAAVGAAVTVAGHGLVSTWQVDGANGRLGIPSWSATSQRQLARCDFRRPRALVHIPLSPPGWVVDVTCRQLRRW